MSSAQRRLFLRSQTPDGDRAYHLIHLSRLRGPFDENAAEEFANRALSRHEALRTGFRIAAGELIGEVHPDLSVSIPILQGSASNLTEELRGLVERLDVPFELSQPPLFRLAVLRLGPTDRIFVTVCHHLVFDGYSGALIAKEIGTVHSGQTLPEGTRNYSDFASWEADFFTSAEYLKQRQFWLDQLPHPPERLALPHDYPGRTAPVAQSRHDFAGATHIVYLPVSELRAVSRELGVTPFHTLLAAFCATLHLWTGQSKITLGTVISPRESGGFLEVVGLIVNSLPLTLELEPPLPFRKLVESVRATVREAMRNADFPFEHMVTALPFREPGARAPLFDVVFNLERNAETRLETFGATTVETLDYDSGMSMFDLTVDVLLFREEARLKVEYSTSLFRAETIAALMDAYQTVLWQALSRPETPLQELSLLSEKTRAQLRQWGTATRTGGRLSSFLETWKKQVLRLPDNPALRWEGTELSYETLDSRSEILARRLRAGGIRPGQVVAVALTRGPDWVASLLALWKTSAIYLPIDTSHPVERLAFQLRESQAALVLVEPGDIHRFDALCPTASLAQLAEPDLLTPLGPPPGPEEVAYIFFTSGSTGVPKGVAIEHRAVAAHLDGVRTVYKLRSDDNVLQFASATFDASLEQVLVSLAAGACLILPPAGHLDPQAMLDFMSKEQVSVAEFPPAYLRLLARALPHPATDQIRCMLSGGDALPPELAQELVERLPADSRLVNIYGPTEATMAATYHVIDGVPSDLSRGVPIGRPLPHTRIALLDQRGRLVPPGMTGEIGIAGERLARGYLNLPELNERSFPWVELPEGRERVYRTGDHGRWLADGTLEFLGRRDRQVQLRGIRLELGEVEHALLSHPDIAEAMVLKKDQPSEHLVALLVPRDSKTLDEESLGAWMVQQLPDSIRPSRLRIVESIRRNSEGKVDAVWAQEALSASPTALPTISPPPREGLEREIWEIWRSVLGREDFGREEGFYRLGGHSLNALEVMVALRQRYGTELSLSILLGDPSVAELARHLTAAPAATTGVFPMGPSQSQGRLVLLFPGLGGNLLDLRELAKSLSNDFSCFGVALAEDEAAADGIEGLAGRVMLQLEQTGMSLSGCLLIGHSFGGYLAFEVARRLEIKGVTPEALLLLDVPAPGTSTQERLEGLELLEQTVAALMGCSPAELALGKELEEALERAGAILRDAGRLSKRQSAESLRSLLQVLESRADAFARYHPKESIETTIRLYRASQPDPGHPFVGEDGGWSSLTRKGFASEWAEGTHFTILKEPGVANLASRVAGFRVGDGEGV